MGPGGTVVAATSEPGRVVTNGMSQYSRAERNANAGIVVGITPDDYPGGPLAGIAFQRKWEERAFELGGGNYMAPGQLVGDFIAGRPSTSLGSVVPSYKPGVHPTDLSTALPDYVIEAIREALPQMDKKIAGFAMHDAVLTGVETRTSSPIRVRRRDDYQSMNVEGLYPAGEGAGYAGGIYSAAIDGIEVAEALALKMTGGQPAWVACVRGRPQSPLRSGTMRVWPRTDHPNDPSHPGRRMRRGAACAVCRFLERFRRRRPAGGALGRRMGDGAATHSAASGLAAVVPRTGRRRTHRPPDCLSDAVGKVCANPSE
jgi:hypothetical protein